MPQAVDVAAIGGNEVFGKYVQMPFPALLEHMVGRPVVNLGVANGGMQSFMSDPVIEEVAQRARVCVLQVMGAQGVSNKYYRVHCRRADRVIAVSSDLRALFPSLDFHDVAFVRQLLARMHASNPENFARVVDHLRERWESAVHSLISRLAMPVVLLRIATSPENNDDAPDTHDPMFVTADMLFRAAMHCDGIIQVNAPTSADDLLSMQAGPAEHHAALHLPSPDLHHRAALSLSKVLQPVLQQVA